LWLKKKKVNLAYRLAFITNGSLEQEEWNFE
jgi:hypothetical protein